MGGIATIMSGRAEKKAYQAQAQEVGLQAKASELQRRDELQDALAMQAVITGASGRAGGEGSVKVLREADIAQSKEDVKLIKYGGRAKRFSLLSAGYRAEQTSLIKGLSQIGTQAASAGKAG